jgi:proteasome lid subunit RPN8/RPN11
LYEEMLAHARAELPNECCGLLAGPPGTATATHLYKLVNEAASPSEYLSAPHSLFEAHRDMRQHGTEILAIYHSHPTSDPVPSRKDLERNYDPDVMNLIISLKKAEPLVRGWWLRETGYVEASWERVDT